MNKITEQEVRILEQKMMLKLEQESRSEVISQIEALIEVNEAISKSVDVSGVQPMTHTISIPNVILRGDNPVDSPPIEEILRNATHVNDCEVEVPKVVG